MKRIGKTELGNGVPAICVPVMGSTAEELKKSMEEASAVPHDVIELRMDSLESAEEDGAAIKALALAREILSGDSILFTFRTEEEGGQRRISEDRYFTMLEEVLKSGLADAVDIEFFKDQARVRKMIADAADRQVFTVLSSHDFQRTPPDEEMRDRLNTMCKLGADAVKLACMPQDPEDVFRLMAATAHMKKRYPNQLFITMSMGRQGVISRIGGEADGSCLTFGSARQASAPGQIPAEELQSIVRSLHIYT